jgi:hypothetical protein
MFRSWSRVQLLWPEFVLIFFTPLVKCLDSTLKEATSADFDILSNSSFTVILPSVIEPMHLKKC